MSATCPSCGKESGGKFCRHCGATLDARSCGKCGQALAPNARFCASCGASTAAVPAGPAGNPILWFAAGGLTVALVGAAVLALSKGNAAAPEVAAATAPFAAGADDPSAVDLASMTPRERFDRLFNRIMRSAEQGDANTVTSFAPMALQAYGMLDTVDADARYHAALIMLHTSDVDGARALADTILKQQPGHLFGYVIKGTIARFQSDQAGLKKSYADFLAHYDTESKQARPEYSEHPRALEEFLKAAQAARGQS
ncbi:MAG: zinc ribbon domain-containing protein [Gemmatimonadales bacterium]|nr:zinc ribbon domain-containing protein [Gemmatimonadales bacterium]MBP9200852.1 zinc ribbon domain-containing protein [Gemmatimonadales bacterium]